MKEKVSIATNVVEANYAFDCVGSQPSLSHNKSIRHDNNSTLIMIIIHVYWNTSVCQCLKNLEALRAPIVLSPSPFSVLFSAGVSLAGFALACSALDSDEDLIELTTAEALVEAGAADVALTEVAFTVSAEVWGCT